MEEDAVRTVGLGKTYRSRRTSVVALQDLSLSVKRGEFVGLLGPNGAGKTTAIRLLCGLLRPTAGRAFVEGNALDERPDAARALIGLVPEDAGDHRNLTLSEELSYYASLYGLSHRETMERSRPLLARLDLTGKEKAYVKTFSRGMRRKFHLIRALLHRPKVLLLDEPTAGLDPAVMEEVWNLLRDLVREQSVTVILCSHHLDEVERLCDRVVIIRQRVLIEGKLADLSGADRRYRLRVSTKASDAVYTLEGMPGVASVRIDHDAIRFAVGHECDPQQRVPEIVRGLVADGVGVLELSREGLDLRTLYRTAIAANGEA